MTTKKNVPANLRAAATLIAKLDWIEVTCQDRLTRTTMMSERDAIAAALRRNDVARIDAAMREAHRVAEMWGVTL